MRNGNRLAIWAACAAALACGGIVHADDKGTTSAASAMSPSVSDQPVLLDEAPATAPAAAAAAAATPRKPLMELLDKVGLAKPLDDARINIFGWIEGGYTYSTSGPPDNVITGRVFDFENQDLTLNQATIAFERTVDSTKKEFDLGFRVEMLYGSDGRLIHSNGLDFYGPGYAANGGQEFPQNQFDLTQAYVDVAVPVGNGLLVRAGKFVTLMGWETINPTTNAFYSHSFEFGFAIPFTQTGVLGAYNVTDKFIVTAGISRGWEQSTVDNNGSIDYFGQFKYLASDKLTLYLNWITGPEEDNDNSHWRTVFDGIASYAATKELTFAIDGDFGWEGAAGVDGQDAQWYGVAGYAGYALTPMFTLNGRAEWFADPQGARGLDTTGVYEVTLGVAITPFPDNNFGSNLKIRPEVRYDYSVDPIFDGGTDDSQFTAAIDAYFTY